MNGNEGRAVHHAYLICGSAERCREVAEGLARAAVCAGSAGEACGRCAHCKKAAAGIHPDIVTVRPEEGKDLTVGQIRALRRDAYIHPNEAAHKVYRIDEAHRMNAAAQNALLKVLEEGPPHAVFLLTAPAEGLLLPTVVSRCQTVRTEGGETVTDEKAAALCDALLAGDAREVLRLCVDLEKRKREELAAFLDTLPSLLLRGEPHRALPIAEAVHTCRAACDRNVGAGHIAGYLAVSVKAGDAPRALES